MELTLTQLLCPPSKYPIKCPFEMKPEGITIHNTANDASAMNEASYANTNDNYTSFHVSVDYERAVQCIPFDRNAYHASDGSTGFGNRKTIAIEICHSKSGGSNFDKSEQNAAILVAYLCKQYGWTIANVKQHYDYAPDKKNCPHRTRANGWDRFLKMVQDAMGGTAPINPPVATNKHIYEINDIKKVNNIWQLKCNYLAPVHFTWDDNGIPLDDVDFTDASGNMLVNQMYDGSQSYFTFRTNSLEFTGADGFNYSYYWAFFKSDNNDGYLWLSCNDLNDLYYRPN